MNKKGVDSILTLFVSTVGVILIMLFFIIFASMLLVTRTYSFQMVESTRVSLSKNFIGFLEINFSEAQNWERLSKKSVGSLPFDFKDSTKEFFNKLYPIGDKGFSYYIISDIDNKYPQFQNILVYNYDSLGIPTCDEEDANTKRIDFYIPNIDNPEQPKELFFCMGVEK